jgi:hypothetical protein
LSVQVVAASWNWQEGKQERREVWPSSQCCYFRIVNDISTSTSIGTAMPSFFPGADDWNEHETSL